MKKKRGPDFSSLRALSFFTQAGLSFCLPLVLCIWGASVLQSRFDLGGWVLLVGIFLGLYSGVSGFLGIIRAMDEMTRRQKEEEREEWMK